MTRPTDWTTSTTELRGCRNSTASRLGTSTPSDRQRAFDRMRCVGRSRVLLEPVEQLVAAQRVKGAVDVIDLAAEHVLVSAVVGIDDGVEVGGDGLGVR